MVNSDVAFAFSFAVRLRKSNLSGMSIEQAEAAIRELTPEERRRLLLWLDEHRHELFGASDDRGGSAESRTPAPTPGE